MREQCQPRPCSATEAVARALSLVQRGDGEYRLGTGDYRPRTVGGKLIDLPYTTRDDSKMGCDCAGVICWCYKLVRHRPGYNVGGPYNVEEHMNCNSMLGDAMRGNDVFKIVADDPRPGDVIAYPSFFLYDQDGKRLKGDDGNDMHWIGHTAIVVGVSRIPRWDVHHPRWDLLDVVQVKGPDGRSPAALATDGSIWMHHDEQWPKAQHRSWLMRAIP